MSKRPTGARITLKSIKYSEFASQETSCYEARLCLDGKGVGVVSNQGGGGCDDQHFDSPEAEAEVQAHLKTLPQWVYEYESDGKPVKLTGDTTLETVCGDILNTWLASKDLKTLLRKKVLALKDDGKLYTYKVIEPDKERVTRSAERVAKFENTVKVLNLLPFDEALKLYKEH